MNTRKHRGGDNSHRRQKDWLSLSVGQRTRGFSSSSSIIASTSMKLYLCNFCKRKFYSPQALGGHQNAHRREKEGARNAFIANNRFIDIHSVVEAPIRDIDINEAANEVIRPPLQNYDMEESADLIMWVGTSYSNVQPAVYDNPHTLDLDLKL
uniref:zinc finger protein 7-like n=1 Tax=Erigeron canadensis TaxID=72917 RepID=UPI001CB8E587|nr:zinc finger protein 7-like [Erigeron canadensis]